MECSMDDVESEFWFGLSTQRTSTAFIPSSCRALNPCSSPSHSALMEPPAQSYEYYTSRRNEIGLPWSEDPGGRVVGVQ